MKSLLTMNLLCPLLLSAAYPAFGATNVSRGEVVMLDGALLAAGSGVVLEHDAGLISLVTATHNLVDCTPSTEGAGRGRVCKRLRVRSGPALTSVALAEPLTAVALSSDPEVSILTNGGYRRAMQQLSSLSAQDTQSNSSLTCRAFSHFLNDRPSERQALTKRLAESLDLIPGRGRSGYRLLRSIIERMGSGQSGAEADRLSLTILSDIANGAIPGDQVTPIDTTYAATPALGIWQFSSITTVHYQADGRHLVGCDGWEGSSGGGVFDTNGKLVGLIQGAQDLLKKPSVAARR